MSASEIDRVLEKLAKDVEAAVHSLYRGEVRQLTARARTEGLVRDARAALESAVSAAAPAAPAPRPSTTPTSTPPTSGVASPRPSVSAPVLAGGAAGWTREEGEAVMKCITAWLPVGPPATTDPQSKCITAMKDLTPTWGQRERAREAVRRISQP
jgi:hypothetical protein